MKVGITGFPGAGKTTVGKLFEKKGFTLICVDDCIPELYMLDDVMDALNKEFGITYITAGEARYKLRQVVFDDYEKLDRLEQLTLKPLQEMIIDRVREAKDKNYCVAIEYALLNQSGLAAMCHKIIRVDAAMDQRVERVEEREWTKEDLLKRDVRQIPQIKSESYCGKEIVLENNGDFDELERKVDQIIADLKKEYNDEKYSRPLRSIHGREKIVVFGRRLLDRCILTPICLLFASIMAFVISVAFGVFMWAIDPALWILSINNDFSKRYKGVWLLYPFMYIGRLIWTIIPSICGILYLTGLRIKGFFEEDSEID